MFIRQYIRLKQFLFNKRIKSVEGNLSLVELKYFKMWSEISKDPVYHLLVQDGKIAISGIDHHMILDSYEPSPKLYVYDRRDDKNICIEIDFDKKGAIELSKMWNDEMVHRFRKMVVEEKNMQISLN